MCIRDRFRKQTAGGDADLTNIVVAFSKRENAVNIRNILTRSGVEVSAVCLTGAKVLQHAEMWSQGIVICGSRLQDMPYTELRAVSYTHLITKYAMPHTRVYIEMTEQENAVHISMKNVSASELNFNADEITDRFVRGDSSRNTEGSGLGLAIAKSFVELQHGTLKISTEARCV